MQIVAVESCGVFSGAIHAVQVVCVCVCWQFQSCGLVRTFSYEAEEKSYEMSFLAFRVVPNGNASVCSLQFEGWSEAKRWRFLERLFSLCSEKHLRRVHYVLEPKVPKARADFTRLLPHNLCLHILGLLDPRTLCRASQVSGGQERSTLGTSRLV